MGLKITPIFLFQLDRETALDKIFPRFHFILFIEFLARLDLTKTLPFIKTEAIILIAKFFQRLDFKLDPNQSFLKEQVAVIRPKDGTKCTLTLRSSS